MNASEHKVGSSSSRYKVCIKISTSRYLKSTPNVYGMQLNKRVKNYWSEIQSEKSK